MYQANVYVHVPIKRPSERIRCQRYHASTTISSFRKSSRRILQVSGHYRFPRIYFVSNGSAQCTRLAKRRRRRSQSPLAFVFRYRGTSLLCTVHRRIFTMTTDICVSQLTAGFIQLNSSETPSSSVERRRVIRATTFPQACLLFNGCNNP